MLSLGIDPDLHNTSIALVEDGKVLNVWVVRVPLPLTGANAVVEMAKRLDAWRWPALVHPGVQVDVLAVEGQEIYRGTTGNPADILKVAQVAGAVLGALSYNVAPTGVTYLPFPADWKGSIPKKIHHGRICKRLGWGSKPRSQYVVPHMSCLDAPVGAELLRISDWKHVMDAIGLALWGHDRVVKARARSAA